jgi:hypothetical protein
MIYDYILLTDRVMNFPASQQRLEEEKTVLAVCDICPQIYDEMEELIYKECGANITVTPDKEMGIPLGIEFNRFQWITVKIDHYKDDSNGWAGMRELVSWLRYGHPEILPDITILFREDNEDAPFSLCPLPDAKWTEEMPACTTCCWHMDEIDRDDRYTQYQGYDSEDGEYESNSADDESDDHPAAGHHEYEETWLRHSDDYFGIPIAIQILQHFLTLPPCKSAVVHPLRGLVERCECLPRHDPEARIFDKDYMEDMCSALGLWLKGERDGIELPRTVSQVYGEARLEQLAYRRHKGRVYCDRDESLYSYRLRAYVDQTMIDNLRETRDYKGLVALRIKRL